MGGKDLYLTIGCEIDTDAAALLRYHDALRSHRATLQARREMQAGIFTSNEQFNE